MGSAPSTSSLMTLGGEQLYRFVQCGRHYIDPLGFTVLLREVGDKRGVP
jgi:hypothetical protein